VIKEGGVQPHIESSLLTKKKKTTSQDTDSTTQAGSKGKKAIKTPKQTAPKTVSAVRDAESTDACTVHVSGEEASFYGW
jgi:hypothetical protein